jgi:hypothetical protein
MNPDTLETIRRCSSLGKVPMGQGRPVDLYHRGQGHRFSIGSADLATLVRRGLRVTQAEQAQQVDVGADDGDVQALVQCGAALLAWLKKEV